MPQYAWTLGTLNLAGLSPEGTRLTNSPAQNHTPGGSQGAQVQWLHDKMYHNLGTKLAGRVRATFWIYDAGEQEAAWYGELRGYTGPGCAVYYQPAGLRQLFAIGRNDFRGKDKLPRGVANLQLRRWAEKLDRTKYQGSAEQNTPTNSGWFNLNAPGAPARSVGWHKFEIVRAADGTTVEFYVDGVLGRRVLRAMT